MKTQLTELLGIEVPVICGAMYPCSNVELIAAVSEAGGIGIIQPLSLVYVSGLDFREGIQKIRNLTKKPIGMNVLVEKTSAIYEDRMRKWVDVALDEGVRFFVTALGNPTWVVERVKSRGGIVFHDVVDRRWADKAIACGVDGLICVNNRAGGHAGKVSPEELLKEMQGISVPIVCAGGVGHESEYLAMLKMGYSGVQMGTRFIATHECSSHISYKEAILRAKAQDIVMTDRVTGVPLSVIRTPYLEKVGSEAGTVLKFLLKHPRTKYWARVAVQLQSVFQLKRSSIRGLSTKDYWQAGKSVDKIEAIHFAGDIVKRFGAYADSN